MGACDFTDYIMDGTVKNDMAVSQAYSQLVEEARLEYGSGGYNGTISTTSGCNQVSHSPMTLSGAENLAAWAMNQYNDRPQDTEQFIPSKWGAALAVPVISDEAFTFKKQTVALTLDDLDESSRRDLSSNPKWAFQEVARNAAIRKFGPAVHSVEVEVDVKYATTVESAAGKSRLVYKVDGSFSVNKRGNIFNTKSEAVAFAKKCLAERPSDQSLTIRAIKVFDAPERPKALPSGEAPGTQVAVPVVEGQYIVPKDPTVAVEVRSVVKSAKAKVTITLATPKSRVPSDVKSGWFFYGLAST